MYINKKEKKKINNKKSYYKKKNKIFKQKKKRVLDFNIIDYKKKYLNGYLDILSKDFKKSISLIKKYSKIKINIRAHIKK